MVSNKRLIKGVDLLSKGIKNPKKMLSYLVKQIPTRLESLPYERKLKQQSILLNNLFKEKNFVLIVLDACRYDYFEQEFNHYLNGTLRKVWSAESATLTWVKKNLSGSFKDTILFSANPFINSKVDIYGYKATDHFSSDKIVDVWDWGYDHKINAIPPWSVNRAFEDYNFHASDKKIIIWYIQPHYPLIGKTRVILTNKELDKAGGHFDVAFLQKIRTINIDNLKIAYRDNLKLVLKAVSALIPKLNGKIVVTSDHGEMLGEHGIFTHHFFIKSPELRIVPWLEVKV